jgi:hypothetical protein
MPLFVGKLILPLKKDRTFTFPLKRPYRNVYGLFQGFLPRKAHLNYGKAFPNEKLPFYSPLVFSKTA